MVLQFKVWRLQRERRGKLYDPRGRKRKHHAKALTLRDKGGRIKQVAKNADEAAVLKTWYEKYNVSKRLKNLLAARKLKEHVRRMKAKIRARGFTYQISLYGIYKNPATGKNEYRRYEIFKAYPWSQSEVAGLHDFFKTHVPKSRAGLFIYYDNKLMQDEKDRLTQFGKSRPQGPIHGS